MQLSSSIKFVEFFIGILKLLIHWRVKNVEVEDGQIFIADTLGFRRKNGLSGCTMLQPTQARQVFLYASLTWWADKALKVVRLFILMPFFTSPASPISHLVQTQYPIIGQTSEFSQMPKQKKKKNSDLFEQEKVGCALDSVTSNQICGHHFQESHALSMRMSARGAAVSRPPNS